MCWSAVGYWKGKPLEPVRHQCYILTLFYVLFRSRIFCRYLLFELLKRTVSITRTMDNLAWGITILRFLISNALADICLPGVDDMYAYSKYPLLFIKKYCLFSIECLDLMFSGKKNFLCILYIMEWVYIIKYFSTTLITWLADTLM